MEILTFPSVPASASRDEFILLGTHFQQALLAVENRSPTKIRFRPVPSPTPLGPDDLDIVVVEQGNLSVVDFAPRVMPLQQLTTGR